MSSEWRDLVGTLRARFGLDGSAGVTDVLRIAEERTRRPFSYSSRTGGRHDALACCPPCGVDVTTTGIQRLAYTWEVCDCDAVEYSHLVEQLWHREHLAASCQHEPVAVVRRWRGRRTLPNAAVQLRPPATLHVLDVEPGTPRTVTLYAPISASPTGKLKP